MIKHTLKVREVSAIIAAFVSLVLIICCVSFIAFKSEKEETRFKDEDK